MKKITCLALSLLMAAILVLSGCKGNDGFNEDDIIPETDIEMVDSSQSKYKIVIPSQADEFEAFAAQELTELFLEATGVALQTISDTGLSLNESSYYFSVGNTNLLAGSGVSVPFSELGRDGFKLVRKGNTLIMAGGGGYGTLYAVYEFLERNLGVRFYALDEILVPKSINKKLLNFNMTEVPVFETRSGTYYKTQILSEHGRKFTARMRLIRRNGEPLFGDNYWSGWGHTHFVILPPSEYYDEHPSWYSADKAQLCLTNEEMTAEFIERLKDRVNNWPNAYYFSITHEDNFSFCNCSSCAASNAQYGGPGGTTMRFANTVARAIKEWMKDAHPGREIKLVTFAYYRTLQAPVDPATFMPVHPSVVAEDNVTILFAPLGSAFNYSLMHDQNSSVGNALKGWANISPEMIAWSYCVNFHEFMLFFNNISTISENYRIMAEHNVKYMFDQANSYNPASPFHDLRVFLNAKLQWDPYRSQNDLTDEFMDAFYKDASPYIYELFNLYRLNYARVEADYESRGARFTSYIYLASGTPHVTKEVFPYPLLLKMLELIDKAYEAIENVSDPKLKETLSLRILTEETAIKYFIISIHSAEYSKAELKNMIDSFEEDATTVGLTFFRANTPLAAKLLEWRAGLL